MATIPQFSVDVLMTGTSRLVTVEGELDAATAPALADALQAAAPGETITVDLEGLTFLDSSGIAVLLAAHRRDAVDGTRLRLTRPSEAVSRVLGICGLLDVLPFIGRSV